MRLPSLKHRSPGEIKETEMAPQQFAKTRNQDGKSPNRLLAALPADEYHRLQPLLKVQPLKFKQILQEPDEKVSAVYFPSGGVCSITHVMEDGRLIEIAVVGNEGMIGMTPFGGDDDLALGETLVQVPVLNLTAQVMSVPAFKREMDARTALYEIIQRWNKAFFAMTMQSAACNGLHTVQERCARWLLQTHDRIGSDEFQLTQEFLAVMLGVRRPSVTLVAGTLQHAGLIKYGHKKITILDRKGLESASCECYRAIKNQFDRILP
jgi:CRP-like cAMP-binding protein